MPIRGALCTLVLTFGYLGGAIEAQETPIPQLTPGSARKLAPASSVPRAGAPLQSVALSIPKGTPLQVALDKKSA